MRCIFNINGFRLVSEDWGWSSAKQGIDRRRSCIDLHVPYLANTPEYKTRCWSVSFSSFFLQNVLHYPFFFHEQSCLKRVFLTELVSLDLALSPRYVTAIGGHVLVEGLKENVPFSLISSDNSTIESVPDFKNFHYLTQFIHSILLSSTSLLCSDLLDYLTKSDVEPCCLTTRCLSPAFRSAISAIIDSCLRSISAFCWANASTAL